MDGGSACTPLGASAPVPLADFDDGVIPSSDTLPLGFRGSDVARGTIVRPGANGSAAAVEFSFASDDSVFFQGAERPRYLDTSPTYHPSLANALELYMRVPAGSSLLATSGPPTFAIFSYHYKPGDPWVGPNPTGGNLTDSQMHGYASMRFAPAAADRWMRVVMATSAFQQSRGNYHFYAGRAIVEDLELLSSMRQFQLVYEASRATGPTTAQFDGFRLFSLSPTSVMCPSFDTRRVSAGGGDVVILLVLANPTGIPRTYRAFLSSEIGVDRQTLEGAMHDADAVSAIDNLQGAVGADGSLGAAELFLADGAGNPMGASVVASHSEIAVPAGGSVRLALVHHVTPSMLGPVQMVMNAGHTYSVRRDTLTTSVLLWDPNEPRQTDPAVIQTGSNSDTDHPAPPGFPRYQAPPAGWTSADVPPDQAGATFVSVLRLLP
jgi:hypothetical protein